MSTEQSVYERAAFFRKAANVQRSHTLRQLRQVRLSEHSYGVMMLLITISERCKQDLLPLLKAAAVHDLSEVHTGDMPATAKWADPALRAELNRASTAFEIDKGLRVYLTAEQAALLSWCDLYEFAQNQLEELRMGNTYAVKYLTNAIENLKNRGVPSSAAVECTDLLTNIEMEFARHVRF